jgi:hypothetical protein
MGPGFRQDDAGCVVRRVRRTSAFSRRVSPELCKSFALETRGRRECRVRAAPAVSCAKVETKTHTSVQVQRRHSGIPCAMALRLISCSPRRDRACLSPPSQKRLRVLRGDTCHRGVRTTRLHRPPHACSSVTHAAATASHRNTRDDREAPLDRVRRADSYTEFCF